MLILRYVRYRDLVVSLAPSHGLVIAWKFMVHNSCDFCNSINYDYSALSQDFKL